MKSASASRAFQRATELLQRCLRPAGAPPLALEYPLVFESRFGGHVVAREEGGDVRSACAVLVRDLIVDQATLRVGLIGSVATASEWRGRGLASRVLDEAEESLAREGCAIALLWADDPAFYAARGYAPIGWEVDFVIPTETLAAVTSDGTLRALAPDDLASVHRLYTLHATRADRSPRETAALLGCPGMSTLVLQRERDVVAYACLGRGADFANTIHEWGGAQDDVVALAAEHSRRMRRRSSVESIALIAPPGARRLRERLTALGGEVHEGVLAMAKVVNDDGLAELFDRFGGGMRCERDSSATGDTTVIRGTLGARSLGKSELLDVLFSRRGDREPVHELERAVGGLAATLPLAPFLWGLDSI